jgi:hypothetical protein
MTGPNCAQEMGPGRHCPCSRIRLKNNSIHINDPSFFNTQYSTDDTLKSWSRSRLVVLTCVIPALGVLLDVWLAPGAAFALWSRPGYARVSQVLRQAIGQNLGMFVNPKIAAKYLVNGCSSMFISPKYRKSWYPLVSYRFRLTPISNPQPSTIRPQDQVSPPAPPGERMLLMHPERPWRGSVFSHEFLQVSPLMVRWCEMLECSGH